MNEAALGANAKVQLIGCRPHQQQVAVPDARRIDLPKSHLDRSRKFVVVIAAQTIVVTRQPWRQVIGSQAKADTIQSAAGVTALGSKGSADQRQRACRMDRGQGSGSRIAGEKVVAGQVRFAAEIGSVGEAGRAGRKQLVAALHKLDRRAGGDVADRSAAQMQLLSDHSKIGQVSTRRPLTRTNISGEAPIRYSPSPRLMKKE